MSLAKRNFIHVQYAASLLIETAPCDAIQGIQNGCFPCDDNYSDLAELAFSYNACMEKLRLTHEKQPFRARCLPKTEPPFDRLAKTLQVTPQRWLAWRRAHQSWSDFGSHDVNTV